MLLLSARFLEPLPLNSLSNQFLLGVIVEAPDIPLLLKMPFKNPCSLSFQVYVCLYLSQA